MITVRPHSVTGPLQCAAGCWCTSVMRVLTLRAATQLELSKCHGHKRACCRPAAPETPHTHVPDHRHVHAWLSLRDTQRLTRLTSAVAARLSCSKPDINPLVCHRRLQHGTVHKLYPLDSTCTGPLCSNHPPTATNRRRAPEWFT
jgi:hypothetical protein